MQNISDVSSLNLTILEFQSLYLLGIVNNGPSQAFVILSLVGFLSGFSIFTTITLSRNLHTKNYTLIACVAFGDMVLATTIMCIGLRRMVYFQKGTPMVTHQLQCMYEDCLRVFAMATINSFFFGCAADRFIAVAKPHWYSKVYPGWLFKIGVVVTFCRAISEPFVLFFGCSKEILLPICAYTFATTTAMLDAQALRNSIIVGGICVVYLATIFLVRVRLGKVKKERGNVPEARKQMQTKVIWTLAIMLGGYVCTIVTSSILYKIALKQTIEMQLKFGLGFALQEISAACNFIILTWKNGDFRRAFFKLYCIDKFYNSKIAPKPSKATYPSHHLSTFLNKFNSTSVKPSQTSIFIKSASRIETKL